MSRECDQPRKAPAGGSGACYAFQKGSCKFGDTCRFSHE
jgi:hypothetical protein